MKFINVQYFSAIMFVNAMLGIVCSEVRCEVTKEEIGQSCINALKDETQFLHVSEKATIGASESRKELIILMGSFASGNGELYALIRKPNTCDLVLSTEGRGLEIKFKKGQDYPDLSTYYTEGRDDKTGIMLTQDVSYYWNGKKYEDVSLRKRMSKSKKLNENALKLFKEGKIKAAIGIWRKISEDGDTASSEVLNNLGFAYHELGKQKKDTITYSYSTLDPKPKDLTCYDRAYNYLQAAIEKDPERWTALLNIGDLEYEINEFMWAAKRYEKLLEVKPDYKNADLIRKRIGELKRKPEKVGVEEVVVRYRSGEKDITYTRVDEMTVLRQGYEKNGELRFTQRFVDGQEKM